MKNPAELTAAFERIADELHHRAFGLRAESSTASHDLTRVKRSGVTVRARQSYVAERSVRPNAAEPKTAIAPLTDDDIDRAIAGASGQRLQASYGGRHAEER